MDLDDVVTRIYLHTILARWCEKAIDVVLFQPYNNVTKPIRIGQDDLQIKFHRKSLINCVMASQLIRYTYAQKKTTTTENIA